MGDAPPQAGALLSSQGIVRNIAVLMGSQLSTWILSVFAAVAIPKFLGAEVLGRFHLANAVWTLGAVVVSFGMSLAITKHVARDRTAVGELLGACVLGRIMLAVPVAVVVFATPSRSTTRPRSSPC